MLVDEFNSADPLAILRSLGFAHIFGAVLVSVLGIELPSVVSTPSL